MKPLTLLLLTVCLGVLSACGSGSDQEPPGSPEPAGQAENADALVLGPKSGPGPYGTARPGSDDGRTSWPPPEVTVSRDEAVQTVRDRCTSSAPEVVAIGEPESPVSRLMPKAEYLQRSDASRPGVTPDDYVWIVQYKQESGSAAPGASPGSGSGDTHNLPDFTYSGGTVDATTGDLNGCYRTSRSSRPYLLPKEFLKGLPDSGPDTGSGSVARASGQVQVSREQAMEIIRHEREGGSYLVDSMELELVRYTSTMNKPKVQDRLAWMVVIPHELDIRGCGPGPQGPDHGGEWKRNTCWSGVSYTFVDAETGESYGGAVTGLGGPRLNNEEFQALQRFAWAEGWWALWHRVKEYSGEDLPDGLAAELDRPDAPTPTPQPPTPTPGPDATPTPTPTPAPTATAAPRATVLPTATAGVLRTPFPTATAAPPAPDEDSSSPATADVAARPDVVSVAIGRVSGQPEEAGPYSSEPSVRHELWPVQVERYVLSPLLYGRIAVRVPDLDAEEYESSWGGGPGLPALEPGDRYVFFLTEIPNGMADSPQATFATPWSVGLSVEQGIVAIDDEEEVYACREDRTCGREPLDDFLRDVARVGMRTARHSGGGLPPEATPEKPLVNKVPVNCAAPQQDDSVKPPPCGPGAEVGEAYAFRLYVHCGPQIAYFDGRRWSADLSQSERGAGTPPGWDDPDESGVMELVSEDRLRFTASNGVTVDFVPADREEYEAFACM